MPRSRLRPLLCGALVLVSPPAIDAACDDCHRPQVVQFDLKVVPPRPTDTGDSLVVQRILEWRQLFWVASGVRSWFFNQDPSRECYTHLNGSFYTSGDSVGKSILFGEEWANLPPASGEAGGDYLVSGSVDGGDGRYVAEIRLQVSKTRQTVSTARLEFTAADEPLTVGKDLARTMGPLLEKIRAFEKEKRAGGEPYALWPIATLVPARTDLRAGESVEVELRLHDCDGDPATSPLPNRKVDITATHGTVNPTTVQTDPDGRAHLIFTAGDQAAEAVLTAEHPYRLASEDMSGARGQPAAVRIAQAPSDQWAVRGRLSRRIVQHESRTTTLNDISGGSTQNTDISARYVLTGSLRNLAPQGTPIFRSEPTSAGAHLEGAQVEIETSQGIERIASIPFWSRVQSFQSARSRPSPAGGAGHIDFQHFQHPDHPERFDGAFSLAGFAIEGTSYRIETSCNSEEGCEESSQEDQTMDVVELTIPVPSDSSGYRRDTSYFESTLSTTIHEERTVHYRDGAYSISSLQTERKSGLSAGSWVEQTFEQQASIEIVPLDPSRHPATLPRPGQRASNPLLTHASLSRGALSVALLAPSAGILRVRLVDLNGRTLLDATRPVASGPSTAEFALPAPTRRVVVLDLSLTPRIGGDASPAHATWRVVLPP